MRAEEARAADGVVVRAAVVGGAALVAGSVAAVVEPHRALPLTLVFVLAAVAGFGSAWSP